VHGPGVGALLNKIDSMELKNLRVIRHDAVEVLERMIGDGALAAIHLFFPDPWPKKRHHKRRLVQPAFVSLMKDKLSAGGIVHLATDWPEYADHMHEVFSKQTQLEPALEGFVKRPSNKFEARGVKLGHPIRDLFFRRRA
jgi:tRNA (guanine-N7-)-methyltransferase